jgi:hypothetical protein
MAACIVQARLAESIPLPPEHDDFLAVRQWIDVGHSPGYDDPNHLDQIVEVLENDLAAARVEFGDSRNHEGDYLFGFAAERAMADYLRERAERLRRQSAGGAGGQGENGEGQGVNDGTNDAENGREGSR